MNWLFWLNIVSGIASVLGLLLTIALSLHGRRVAKANLERFHDHVFRERVCTVLIERKRYGRPLSARDAFYIMLAVADELGIRRPKHPHLLKPILFQLIEHTLLMAERTPTLNATEKTTIARSLGAIMKEISSWETTPPGSIRDFSPVRWMEVCLVGGCTFFALAIILPWATKAYLSGVGVWEGVFLGAAGWYGVFVLFLENMQFVEEEYKFSTGDNSSELLIQAAEIHHIVSISDTTSVTWNVKPKDWWMTTAGRKA
jgi:hypothetical protein